MSLVIAIKDKGRVLLGSDKLSCAGNNRNHTATKVWDVLGHEGCCMGGVGLVRANQIIQYSRELLDKNYFDDSIPIEEYIVLGLTRNIYNALSINGLNCALSDAEDPELKCYSLPNSFLFAYKDRCWVIGQDLSVSEIEDFIAIGSGAEVATGSLIESGKCGLDPFTRIVHAIEAASEETMYVDDSVEVIATQELEGDSEAFYASLGIDLTPPVKEEPKEEPEKKSKKKRKKKENTEEA